MNANACSTRPVWTPFRRILSKPKCSNVPSYSGNMPISLSISPLELSRVSRSAILANSDGESIGATCICRGMAHPHICAIANMPSFVWTMGILLLLNPLGTRASFLVASRCRSSRLYKRPSLAKNSMSNRLHRRGRTHGRHPQPLPVSMRGRNTGTCLRGTKTLSATTELHRII